MKKYSYLLPMTIMATVANVYGANRGSDRPNVVFIYADDIGYGDLSCNGATTIHTPHVERLAANGIRFTNAHAAAATSTPSRYAMLTGEYAWRRQGTGIAAGNAGMIIRPERYTREFVDAKGAFTLSFLGEEHKTAHKICGAKSGRDIDKVAATGLTPCFTDLGNPCFEESRLTLECKTLYVTKMDKDHFVDPALYEKWYSAMAGNPHNVYVAEILNAWER